MGGLYTLDILLNSTIKLFAPFLPYVTECIYLEMYSKRENILSIHQSSYPCIRDEFLDEDAGKMGELLKSIASVIRRYKSEKNLGLGSELPRVKLGVKNFIQRKALEDSISDLISVTRAKEIIILPELELTNQPLFTATDECIVSIEL